MGRSFGQRLAAWIGLSLLSLACILGLPNIVSALKPTSGTTQELGARPEISPAISPEISPAISPAIFPTTSPTVAQFSRFALTPAVDEASKPPAAAVQVPLKQAPSSQAIEVKVGLYVTNLADVNQSSETFDIAGYLFYRWRDPRLAFDPKKAGSPPPTPNLNDIWHPALEMVNFKETKESQIDLSVAPDGTVTAQDRFSRTLSSSLLLKQFPFDSQKLQVVIESLIYPESQVNLTVDPNKVSIGNDSFVSLSEWTIQGIESRVSRSYFPPEQQHYTRATLDIIIQRNSGFYLFKVMMPLMLITIASWTVFWIDPREFSTQITIAFTNLLTVVALLLVVNDSLPKMGYLTFMDGFTMLCFIGILAAILELVLAHRWEIRDDHKRAAKVHRVARWLVPCGFILTGCLLWAGMFYAQ
jgi:hypothetical protein